MRGKPPPCARCLRPKRITPAGAGKTLRRTHLFNVQWDHPRRCGENRDELYVGCPQGGSPPQVRGKPAAEQGGGGIPRITPAGAGKTLQRTAVLNAGQDHPRRCGENLKLLQPLLRGLGSPPQVRGKPELSRIILMSHRITPAGAGKTMTIMPNHAEWWNHPRRCGENEDAARKKTDAEGSPPQVRGKPQRPRSNIRAGRITPAGAGKTPVSGTSRVEPEDHPRRCGENPGAVTTAFTWAGSPPQVRGKPYCWWRFYETKRITPAGAGKTGFAYVKPPR